MLDGIGGSTACIQPSKCQDFLEDPNRSASQRSQVSFEAGELPSSGPGIAPQALSGIQRPARSSQDRVGLALGRRSEEHLFERPGFDTVPEHGRACTM